MSANLNAPALVGGQANPETTTNDAIGALDAAFTELIVVDLTNDASLSAANYRAAMRFSVNPVGSGGKELTLPAVQRMAYFSNDGGGDDVEITRGATTITLADGEGGFFYTDGTTDGLEKLASSGGGGGGGGGGPDEPFDLATYCIGTPIANQVLLRFVAVREFTLPSGLSGSEFDAGVAATASTTVTLQKNGGSIGTLVWAISGTTPTVTFSSDETFSPGDVFEIVAPATPDATLSQIALSFKGSRVADTSMQPADLSVFVADKPGAGAVILRFTAVRDFVWPSGLVGSYFTAGVASSGTATFTIEKNGGSIGSIVFASDDEGTPTFSSTVFFVAGDVIEINAPGSQDGALADVAFNFLGSR